MAARKLLADPNRRKGYSLPESLIGLMFNTFMMLTVYYLMTWLRR